MKNIAFALLMLTCISICGQASGEIITGEWKQEMIGEKAYIHPGCRDWPSSDDTVAVYSGPGEQYPEVGHKLLRTLQCLDLEGDWALVTDAEPSFWDTDPFEGIGYINISGFEKKPDKDTLHYANVPVEAPNDCCLLRYPLDGYYGEYLGIIRQGEELLLLSVYGDFIYVQANLDGVPTKGFISKNDYSILLFLHEINSAGLFAGSNVLRKELYAYQYAVLKKDSLAAGNLFTIGLRSDGTVIARGNNEFGQCDVQGWRNIIAVAAGSSHTVGLRSNGTVVAVGSNQYGQCDVSEWRNVIAISAGFRHTVGLLENGRVVVAGDNTFHQHDLEMRDEDVVAISAGGFHTVALTDDGRVLGAGGMVSEAYRYSNTDVDLSQTWVDTQAWSRITSIAAGGWHGVGLRADGFVVASGESSGGELDVDEWESIVEIAAGGQHTFGLTSDGTVCMTGGSADSSSNIWEEDWHDVVFISASETQLVGVKKDGSVMNYQYNFFDYPYYELDDWTDIGLPEDAVVFDWQ